MGTGQGGGRGEAEGEHVLRPEREAEPLGSAAVDCSGLLEQRICGGVVAISRRGKQRQSKCSLTIIV